MKTLSKQVAELEAKIPADDENGDAMLCTLAFLRSLLAERKALRDALSKVLEGYDNPENDGAFDWVETAEQIRAALGDAE